MYIFVHSIHSRVGMKKSLQLRTLNTMSQWYIGNDTIISEKLKGTSSTRNKFLTYPKYIKL